MTKLDYLSSDRAASVTRDLCFKLKEGSAITCEKETVQESNELRKFAKGTINRYKNVNMTKACMRRSEKTKIRAHHLVLAAFPVEVKHMIKDAFTLMAARTFSWDISVPRFPREKMMSSASCRISSKWVNPSIFSIFA